MSNYAPTTANTTLHAKTSWPKLVSLIGFISAASASAVILLMACFLGEFSALLYTLPTLALAAYFAVILWLRRINFRAITIALLVFAAISLIVSIFPGFGELVWINFYGYVDLWTLSSLVFFVLIIFLCIGLLSRARLPYLVFGVIAACIPIIAMIVTFYHFFHYLPYSLSGDGFWFLIYLVGRFLVYSALALFLGAYGQHLTHSTHKSPKQE